MDRREIIDTIQRFSRQWQSVIAAAELLEDVESLDRLANEARNRADVEKQAAAAAVAAAQEAEAKRAKADAARTRAYADADVQAAATKQQIDEMLAAGKLAAADLIAAAKAEDARLRAEHGEIQGAVVSKRAELSELQADIDRLKSKFRS